VNLCCCPVKGHCTHYIDINIQGCLFFPFQLIKYTEYCYKIYFTNSNESFKMFGSRRLAKRSIIGTRVCAPWNDGRYYPGVISTTQTWPNGEEVFTVTFDDGYSKTLQDRDLIGPGFQTIQHAKLKSGQRVFITYNGREVSGKVEDHDTSEDNVFIRIESGSEDIEIDRKLEEVRLLPSRKSSRLQKQDTDYSRLADMPTSEAKKRTVSQIIDVPSPAAKQRYKSLNSSKQIM
jgi:hypothetical protein